MIDDGFESQLDRIVQDNRHKYVENIWGYLTKWSGQKGLYMTTVKQWASDLISYEELKIRIEEAKNDIAHLETAKEYLKNFADGTEEKELFCNVSMSLNAMKNLFELDNPVPVYSLKEIDELEEYVNSLSNAPEGYETLKEYYENLDDATYIIYEKLVKEKQKIAYEIEDSMKKHQEEYKNMFRTQYSEEWGKKFKEYKTKVWEMCNKINLYLHHMDDAHYKYMTAEDWMDVFKRHDEFSC
ncbi:MAG: hypothetical protein V1870_03665 [Candidatus Aenigmatarchaeota archaeon]